MNTLVVVGSRDLSSIDKSILCDHLVDLICDHNIDQIYISNVSPLDYAVMELCHQSNMPFTCFELQKDKYGACAETYRNFKMISGATHLLLINNDRDALYTAQKFNLHITQITI